MKNKVVNNCYNFIIKRKNLEHIEKIKIKYGLEILYNLITKCTVILLFAFILNIFKEVLLLFLGCLLIRKSAYGVHAKTNIGCWISSSVSYLGVGLFVKYINVHPYILILINIYSLIAIILWAPSDTKGKPIVNPAIRKSLKIRSIITFVIICICLLFIKYYYAEIITFGMLISTITLNPLTYYIFKCPRNNYLNYK